MMLWGVMVVRLTPYERSAHNLRNADFQIVDMHWNPDGLSFVAADTKGNCYLFGIGDNKRAT